MSASSLAPAGLPMLDRTPTKKSMKTVFKQCPTPNHNKKAQIPDTNLSIPRIYSYIC